MNDWPWPKESVFTPFIRRFTDERALDLRELKKLYGQVQQNHARTKYTASDARIDIGSEIYDRFSHLVPNAARTGFCVTLDALLKLETTIFEFPALNWDIAVLSMKEQVDLRHFLRAKEHFLANHDRIMALLTEALDRIFGSIALDLPQVQAEPSLFTIPLICTLPQPRMLVEKIYGTVCEDSLVNAGLLTATRDRMYRNLCDASDMLPYEDNGR